MLELKHICQSYKKGKPVLRDISFTIPPDSSYRSLVPAVPVRQRYFACSIIWYVLIQEKSGLTKFDSIR